MHSFSEIYANISISLTALKLDYLDYILVADSMDLFSTTLTQLTLKLPNSVEQRKITTITPVQINVLM